MKHILESFTKETLFSATASLLDALNIKFDRETAEPVSVAELYDAPIPLYLNEALKSIKNTYFIGIINDSSLSGAKPAKSLTDVAETIQHTGRYDGLFVFACDVKQGANLSRTAISALTRAFNRIAYANPVILVVRNDDTISLSTCERMDYTQEWRQEFGEKLGKVSILRNVNCKAPHRGHMDILASLAEKSCSTFEELYNHWMKVFSCELLTKKFYGELSDWYAWAVKVVRFPNKLDDVTDDDKYNYEAVIRLVTRLIFVWFLKQKHLIPDEFFDEKYIADNLLKDFNPNLKTGLFGEKSLESKYYKAILQNLFFAMLNCPITKEGESELSERYFSSGSSDEDDNKKLMHYNSMFKNPELFIELANKTVPFLNGGLFDCLDYKDFDNYVDGFSDRDAVKKSLVVPDYLFFGEEAGKNIDLSEWYGDRKKKKVSARGIIDIFKRYNFTVEENTPYEQEVSLDPELLGKVFENLLASYNPETQTTARKQTGSFYTPRNIVQYMVDESLVAYLKRIVGEELEVEFRKLISYANEKIELNGDQKLQVMEAIYHCKVLDPACGSGAFPVGMMQQMVHILSKLDPTNEQWEKMILDEAVSESRSAFQVESKEECEERLFDIRNSFDEKRNYPDYARKLYLIENCIYGVDIQPIAIQISKLRFFISLVVDQKTNDDPTANFGIRPLPNLEAKFVAANSLIPLAKREVCIGRTEEIVTLETKLKETNHKIFSAKTVRTKRKWKERLVELRSEMATKLVDNGFLNADAKNQITSWDMFDQNTAASFFDADWMFGIKDGFDIVIGNPPFIDIKGLPAEDVKLYFKLFKTTENRINVYSIFIEKGTDLLSTEGVLCYINPNSVLINESYLKIRGHIIDYVDTIVKLPDTVFESATVETIILLLRKNNSCSKIRGAYFKKNDCIQFDKLSFDLFDRELWQKDRDKIFNIFTTDSVRNILNKISEESVDLESLVETSLGITPYDKYRGHDEATIRNRLFHAETKIDLSYVPLISGKNIHAFYVSDEISEYLKYGEWLGAPRERKFFEGEKIIIRQILSGNQQHIIAAYSNKPHFFTQIGFSLILKKSSSELTKFLVCLLNSELMTFYHRNMFLDTEKVVFQKILIANAKKLPIKVPTDLSPYVDFVDSGNYDDVNKINKLIYRLYNFTYDEILIVDPSTPITREEYDCFKLDN